MWAHRSANWTFPNRNLKKCRKRLSCAWGSIDNWNVRRNESINIADRLNNPNYILKYFCYCLCSLSMLNRNHYLHQISCASKQLFNISWLRFPPNLQFEVCVCLKKTHYILLAWLHICSLVYLQFSNENWKKYKKIRCWRIRKDGAIVRKQRSNTHHYYVWENRAQK